MLKEATHRVKRDCYKYNKTQATVHEIKMLIVKIFMLRLRGYAKNEETIWKQN